MHGTQENFINSAEILFSLKKKEAEVTELLKIKKRYEYELETINEKYIEKEYRLKRLEDEHLKLKQKLKELSLASGNSEGLNLPSEILKQKSEIKYLKDKIRSNERESKDRYESETLRLSNLLAESERAYQSLRKTVSPANENMQKVMKTNVDLSEKLINLTEKIEPLEAKIRILEDELSSIKQENQYLIEENIRLEDHNIVPDAQRLKIEVEIILHRTYEISLAVNGLKSRMEMLPLLSAKSETSDNIFTDINTIKGLLLKIKEVLIDIHTEAYGNELCTPQ